MGAAIAKFKALRGAPASSSAAAAASVAASKGAGAILVFYKEKILPVKMGEIALFYLQHEVVRLVTFGSKEYIVNKSLEELEALAGASFYRVNRQFLVNRLAIKDVSQYFGQIGRAHV